MFVTAIETVSKFTRPIYSILRYHNSTTPIPSAAALFFVNRDGWALTCRHVANLLLTQNDINQNYKNYSQQKSAIPQNKHRGKQLSVLAKKFNYSESSVVQLQSQVFNSFIGGGNIDFDVFAHPNLDLALIKFRNFITLNCTSFATFPKDTTPLKQGRFLCRLGYPFAEFNHFQYDQTVDEVVFTDTGRMVTPQFPIEGMLTRFLSLNESQVGFELSTPGLKGQSGGPAFDTDGKIWGIQASTAYHDLEFDKDLDIIRNGRKKHVSGEAFLHVGNCIHIDAIKTLMEQHNVAFTEV